MNFENLPKPLKIIILIILFGLIAAGIINYGDINIPRSPESAEAPSQETPKTITINLVVRDNSNNPLEGVKVNFVGNFSDEPVTNSNGYVKISFPDQEDIEIVMIKEGYKSKRVNVNTKVNQGKPITYFLDKINENSGSNEVSIKNIAQNKCFETTTIDNFEISLKECEQSGSTIILYLDIKNLGRSRDIKLYTNQSRIINSGNYYYAANTYIGQPLWRQNSQETIPHSTTVKAAFKFDDIIINQNEASFIELNTSISLIEFPDKSI